MLTVDECATTVDCLRGIQFAVERLGEATESVSWVDVLTLVITAFGVLVLGLFGALLSARTVRLTEEQARAASEQARLADHQARFVEEQERARDRQELRLLLREWFQGLSVHAKKKPRRRHDSLRSQIEEIADANGFGEILLLLDWAKQMHDGPAGNPGSMVGDAHLRRVVVKRRFRQMIARWGYDRAVAIEFIEAYTSRGRAVIDLEPDEVEFSATALLPRHEWEQLPATAWP